MRPQLPVLLHPPQRMARPFCSVLSGSDVPDRASPPGALHRSRRSPGEQRQAYRVYRQSAQNVQLCLFATNAIHEAACSCSGWESRHAKQSLWQTTKRHLPGAACNSLSVIEPTTTVCPETWCYKQWVSFPDGRCDGCDLDPRLYCVEVIRCCLGRNCIFTGWAIMRNCRGRQHSLDRCKYDTRKHSVLQTVLNA